MAVRNEKSRQPPALQDPDLIPSLVALYDRYDERIPYQGSEVDAPIQFDPDDVTLCGRLLRAAEDQVCGDPAAISRYMIWGETLRGLLLAVVNDLDERSATERTRDNCIRALNSISAFCEIQRSIGWGSEIG